MEAEEAVAAEVVKKMGILVGGESTDAAETSDPVLYSTRVGELLGARHNGVWSTQVEKEYESKFCERLPSLWYQEAEALNTIRVDCPVLGSGRYIVFPALPASSSTRKEPRAEVRIQQKLPPLQYPTEDLWDIYVTYLRSTTDVSIRLIGPDYSEKFDELSSSMDLHYYDKTATPGVQRPEIGRLYAAYVSSDWHRVKVVEVKGIMCTCMFLDHGDQDTIPVEDLKEIDPKFLELSLQAFTISLSGLEDYEYNENIVSRLNQHLLGKSLVAKVDNRSLLAAQYSVDNPPRMVLFDTSSLDIDVNINQKLIELLISEDNQSRLPQPGGEEIKVVISHIDASSGAIYVQKDANSYSTIDKLICENTDKFVSNGPSGIMGVGQLYIARSDDKFYRGEVQSTEKVDGMYKVFLVDVGNTVPVEPSAIYDLSGVCEALYEMPRLALKCTLEGLPPEGHSWSPEATAAMRDIVPSDQVVKLKVLAGPTLCPRVELHQLDTNQGSINFDLSTEFDIFPALPTGLSAESSVHSSPARQSNGVPPTVEVVADALKNLPVKGRTIYIFWQHLYIFCHALLYSLYDIYV